MSSKKILLSVFILVALAQLYVPAKMILDKEDTLETGTDYKFQTTPIDPTDPFRGKYIILSYRDNVAKVKNEKDWVSGETVYVFLENDQNEFAKITSVSKEKPAENQGFVKAIVSAVSSNGTNKLTIYYPFDRYYMEESKANDAELIYRKSLQDTTQLTFALVSIKNGDAVLKDVLIDGISIREIVKAKQ
ncbi:MAG: GDYXXLXY domain-containing protein [Lutibacter sp.]